MNKTPFCPDSMTLIIDGEEVEVRAIHLGEQVWPAQVEKPSEEKQEIEQRAAAAAEDARTEFPNTPLRLGPDGCILPGQGVEGGVDWSSIEIDGRKIDAKPPVSSSVKFELTLSSPDSFNQYKNFIESIEKQVYQAILGQPSPMYREDNGTLYQRCGGSASIAVVNLRLKNARMWMPVGITRPGPKNNRLRKFVRRAGRLVEVRTRGRTGHRSLEEAITAAKQ